MHPSSLTETQAPRASAVEALMPGAYFHDAWQVPAADPGLDALGQFLRVARTTPRWVERLMALRNRLVALVGLKNLGGLAQIDAAKPASSYRPGDRVGIFTLISSSDTEVLLGDRDKHLDVVVSVHTRAAAASAASPGPVMVTVTTVVHVHNWLGRLYMLPVAPLHRVIARSLVAAVGRAA